MFSSLDRSFTILCLWKMPVKPCGNYLSTLLAKLLLACKYNKSSLEIKNSILRDTSSFPSLFRPI